MRRQNIIPALIIFSTFLISGLLTGRWIGHSIENLHQKTSADLKQGSSKAGEQVSSLYHSFAPQAPANFQDLDLQIAPRSKPEQRNILFVGVDHLGSPAPTLESIWLILYIQDIPQLTWMPIFPEVTASGRGVEIHADTSLEGNSQLWSDSLLSQEFQQALREKHIRWDNFIILDQAAVADVIDALGGLDKLSSRQAVSDKIDGLKSVAALSPVNESPQTGLFSQANLIQQLCRTSPQAHINITRLQNLFKTLDSHLITDLEPEQIIADMNSMLLYGGNFTCEFPSLTLLSSEIRAPAGTK